MKYNKTKYPNIYYYETAKGNALSIFMVKRKRLLKVVSQPFHKLVQP